MLLDRYTVSPQPAMATAVPGIFHQHIPDAISDISFSKKFYPFRSYSSAISKTLHQNHRPAKPTKFPIFRASPSSQISMAAQEGKKDVYSVWGVPPEDVTARIKKLMEGLRSEFGAPQFEPHVTIVGAISLTESEARDKFRKACEGLKTYDATVLKVDTGTHFYQCVFLLLDPTTQVN